MFGVREFTAVINPPHGCILAVGAGEERPVVKRRRARDRHGDELTLSCDHRVVDGAIGAQFLAAFKKLIEDPLRCCCEAVGAMADNSFDLIVVGGGPGGYVAAIRAAQLGMKTAVVEREQLGGICLNWGCIPTKALLRSSEIYHLLHQLDEYGFSAKDIRFDAEKIVARSRAVAKQLSNGVGFLMKKNKVTVFDGQGRLAGKGKLAVDQGRQAGRRARRQEHHPGDRRAGARAAGARARRQAGLDL